MHPVSSVCWTSAQAWITGLSPPRTLHLIPICIQDPNIDGRAQNPPMSDRRAPARDFSNVGTSHDTPARNLANRCSVIFNGNGYGTDRRYLPESLLGKQSGRHIGGFRFGSQTDRFVSPPKTT